MQGEDKSYNEWLRMSTAERREGLEASRALHRHKMMNDPFYRHFNIHNPFCRTVRRPFKGAEAEMGYTVEEVEEMRKKDAEEIAWMDMERARSNTENGK